MAAVATRVHQGAPEPHISKSRFSIFNNNKSDSFGGEETKRNRNIAENTIKFTTNLK